MTYLYLKIRWLVVKVFYPTAKLSRLGYAKSILIDISSLAIVFFLVSLVGSESEMNVGNASAQYLALFIFLTFIFFMMRSGASTIRRLTDLGFSTYYILLLLVPGLNIFLLLFLFLKKGEDQNKLRPLKARI